MLFGGLPSQIFLQLILYANTSNALEYEKLLTANCILQFKTVVVLRKYALSKICWYHIFLTSITFYEMPNWKEIYSIGNSVYIILLECNQLACYCN